MKKIAIILAGGIGTRSGASIPKQFVEINNKPLIVYTLEKFNNNRNIDLICVVCHKDWICHLEQIIKEYKIEKAHYIVEGGMSGLGSVYNGIKKVNEFAKDDSLILIHDAVRPFIDNESINENILIAEKNGLAMCAVPLVETLVYSEDGVYSNKITSRDNLYRILTPQTFKLSILNELYSDENVINSNEPSTFSLYMKKGLPIYIYQEVMKRI